MAARKNSVQPTFFCSCQTGLHRCPTSWVGRHMYTIGQRSVPLIHSLVCMHDALISASRHEQHASEPDSLVEAIGQAFGPVAAPAVVAAAEAAGLVSGVARGGAVLLPSGLASALNF